MVVIANLEYGIGPARRSWLVPGKVLNSRGLEAFKKLLKRTARG
jgi:hypothetical protein